MRGGGPARLGLGPARFHSNMQIGNHIEIAAGYSWANGLCPVLPPLRDILVLRLTRSSCGVYKTVTGMCSAFLSQRTLKFIDYNVAMTFILIIIIIIFLRIRVNVLRSRA